MTNPVNPVNETELKTKCDTGLEMVETLDYSRSDVSHEDERGVSVVGGESLSLCLCLCFPLCLSLCLY